MTPLTKTHVGITEGLTMPSGPQDPEQVYVYVLTDPDDKELARPVLIEGWDGYDIPIKMRITRKQTVDLIGLLLRTVAVP